MEGGRGAAEGEAEEEGQLVTLDVEKVSWVNEIESQSGRKYWVEYIFNIFDISNGNITLWKVLSSKVRQTRYDSIRFDSIRHDFWNTAASISYDMIWYE